MGAPALLCPLRLAAQEAASDVARAWEMVANGHTRCLGGSCAWWVCPPGACAVTAMARNMVIATRTMVEDFGDDDGPVGVAETADRASA